MKTIPLNGGFLALLDLEDFERLKHHRWYACKKGRSKEIIYARAWNNKKTPLAMHRLVLDAPRGSIVDHIDGDGLNNQRSNLRIVTYSVNALNKRKQPKRIGTPPSSSLRGISKNVRPGRRDAWRGALYINRKCVWRGSFLTEAQAFFARRLAEEIHCPGVFEGR